MRLAFATIAMIGANFAAIADEVGVSKFTTVNKAVEIGRHSSVDNTCRITAAGVVFDRLPTSGRVRTSTGNNLIDGGLYVSQACLGRTGPASIVVYTPRRGFTGTDIVSYTTVFPGSTGRSVTRHFTVTIEVSSGGVTTVSRGGGGAVAGARPATGVAGVR